jgi:2-keto-3-deoxy-L-rhamnonate aldolase RhmA
MSQLQKKITKTQRREGTTMGFGAASREQPRAMLLAAIANDARSAKAAAEAGADVIIVRAAAASATGIVESLAADKLTIGVWSEALDEPASNALSKAGCDFVVSTLEGTASAAVDTERMGQLVVASESMDDSTLRSLAPLGLDGLFVDRPSGAMTLAQQLALVRIGSFASAQLMVTIDAGASVSDLRVLRDSGVATVVVAAGTSADQIKGLIESLKAVPAPRKGRDHGREMAIVPSLAAGKHEEEEEEEEEDDDDE